jgi:broad specificity phosphatase PhoE
VTIPIEGRSRDFGPTTTVVHLMRHGEVHNPTGVLYGRLPGFRLSPAGEGMARAAAAWFADRDVTHLVASPLERAQQTARPVSEALQLGVATDDRLIEAGSSFEGKTFGVGDGALRRPANWWLLRNPWLPSWGEPYREIAARMLGAVASARDAARGHEAVCVSHQLPIWTVRLHLEGRSYLHDPRRRECGLASVTSLVYEDDRLARLEYSEPAGSTDRDAVPGA